MTLFQQYCKDNTVMLNAEKLHQIQQKIPEDMIWNVLKVICMQGDYVITTLNI